MNSFEHFKREIVNGCYLQGNTFNFSLLALLLAVVIAIPVAVLVSPSKKISGFLLQIAGIIQTLPSLALIGLFIPLMGIGTFTSFNDFSVICVIPDFTKYDYGTTGD